jgi:uroporphyrin-3 C-methyltransferase
MTEQKINDYPDPAVKQSTPPEKNQQTPKASRSIWMNVGIFFSTLGIIILICAFAYGYRELSKVNIDLARIISDLTNQNTRNQQDITTLKSSLNELQQISQKTQALSAQQEQFIAEWRSAQKGDLNKWKVAEAHYLVKLADDQLQFSNNTQLAMVVLQEAIKTLATVQDANVNEIQKSLATDLLKLKATPTVDVTAVYVRLHAVANQIDKLPLAFNPLKAQQASQKPASPTLGLPWWKAGLISSWEALRKIVIVRHYGANNLPLILPDEKIFLYQNLHSQIENAMWGLLHHNTLVYTTSLSRAKAWIKQYFAQEAQETKTLLQEMDALQKETVQFAAINLSTTLQLFDQYNAQVKNGN